MSDRSASFSRRQFCAGACHVASGATLATLFSACGGSPTSPGGGGTSTLAVLAGQLVGSGVRVTPGAALANAGDAALVESTAGVFLMARTSASAFMAIDAVCTHEGCTITGAQGSDYVCPCHGSRYTRDGRVIGGPAMANLRQYSTTFANDVVTIAI
jgi:Rieske Fe-S protein